MGLNGYLAERQLPAILVESRKRQVNVTNQLADQVFDALQILLRGFEAAGEHDANYRALLRDALERGDDHLYGGLLTVLLRLVFVLYAEDRGMLPVDTKFYAENFSVLALFDELQHDHGAFPDSMSRRYGAWPRLLSLFRAIFLGCEHGDLKMPARRGELFDPHLFPFLEGWGPAGSAPITMAENRAEVAVPGVDDETVFRVMQKLLLLEGQRLSYRALDVEQIGSVYEALMGYHVQRVEAPSVCLKPDRAKAVWVSAVDSLAQKKVQRGKWFKAEVGLTKGHAEKLAKALAEAKDEDASLKVLEGYRVKHTETAAPGRLVIQPGSERKRTSSHYTPRSLSAPIVEKTLAPLIRVMGNEPSSERLLNLKVCDPAMGSGAFLVESCRYLGDQVVAAWTRERRFDMTADRHDTVENHARRLVAQRCLYGVDKNKFAVNLAKLSLWLVTLAKDEPFTFVDHALRHGDSLVGLDFEQIKSFHWQPSKQLDLCRGTLEAALDEAISLRQQILDLAAQADELSTKEKYRLLRDAEDALEHARLIGDLVVGAFFSAANDNDRHKERDRRLGLVESWLQAGGPPSAELIELQQAIRRRFPIFHWMTEFPEIFHAQRPDPLDDDQVNDAAAMDAFLGNPPFAGKNGIVQSNGAGYTDWLMAARPEVKGRPNTDLCAYFFRRGADLLGRHGVLGFIATNTIAQGDSRLMSLKALTNAGASIYDARVGFLWPGSAAVVVSTVHLALGSVKRVALPKLLNGEVAQFLDSRLRPRPEREEPRPLASNQGIAFMGGKLVGIGLVVDAAERDNLVAENRANGKVLRPYLGGEEVNRSTSDEFERYVIDFSTHTLEKARRWPQLLNIVEQKVKPARMKDKRGTYQTYWWRPGESGGALYKALDGLSRCLVSARVTKHLMFSFKPVTPFFGDALYVFAFDGWTQFPILQSRIHEPWTRLLSSSLEDRLRYAASDCFDTFPFPQSDPRAVIADLESIGERLYEARARYMVDTNQGLTQTYNRLKDPDCLETPIEKLRQLHIEMDRAVLGAYGWNDIEVPPFTTPTTPEQAKTREAFQDEVIDRLFVLNAERAKEEKLAGKSTKNSKGKSKGGSKRKKASDNKQLSLLDGGSK